MSKRTLDYDRFSSSFNLDLLNMENQWDHFQQDIFKKANHSMVILTNFHPSLEEKQKF